MPMPGGRMSAPFRPRLRLVGAISASLLLWLFATVPLHADDDPLQQRTRFLAAKRALEQGDAQRFLQNAATLQDYPLYPYLVYWHLRENLDAQSNAAIQAFLDSHANTPLAPLLRSAWLRHLAAEGRWSDYLAFYQGARSAELRCYAHLAQLHGGDRSAAWAGARRLWLVGYSQHKACDPLFAAWDKAGGLTPELRMQRIELAMARGNSGLAGYLAKPLDDEGSRWVNLWRRVDNQPERILDEAALQEDNEQSRRIVVHGLTRLASRDPAMAATVWPKMLARHVFTPEQRRQLNQSIALNFAFDGDARALDWFANLPQERLTTTSAGWAVRAALRQGNWKAARNWIARVPQRQRNSEQWRYWLARAQEALGNQDKAQALYQSLSRSRTYYGFLAADRVDSPYNLEHEPLEVGDEAIAGLQQKPALVRARELYHLTLVRDARREWDYAISKMNRQERLVAGKLAESWQWYDRALLALAKAGHFDDLNIRFPLAYHEAVTQEAKKRGLDPAWVYAVARQESGFIEDVRSSAGALGLMQLMPSTGRTIARQLNTSVDPHALLEPETNIRFGSYYLQQVLKRFNDNPVLATAAYNAGPKRIDEWTPRQGRIDADIWVDTMPFHETRQYVRRVMAYSVFYDQRLAQPIKRLNLRMPPVGKGASASAVSTAAGASPTLLEASSRID